MLNGRAKRLAAHHRAGETSTSSQAEVIAVSTVTCPAMQQSRRPGADITERPLDGCSGQWMASTVEEQDGRRWRLGGVGCGP